jgi:hypothetical protein
MPQEQQIQIQPQQFGIRVPDVPINPEYAAASNLGKDITQQSVELGILFHKHEQMIQDHQAVNKYFEEHNKLLSAVANTHDFNEKKKLYSEGVQNIYGEINQQYPDLSPEGQDKIYKYGERNARVTEVQLLKQQETYNKNSLDFTIKNSIEQASVASSNDERNMILGNGIDVIKLAEANGIITSAESKFQQFHLFHETSLADWNSLIDKHPEIAIQIPRDKIAITDKEHREGVNQAVAKVHQQDTIAKLEYEHNRTNALLIALSNPDRINDDNVGKYLTADEIRAAQGHRPTNDPLRNSLMSQLDNTHWQDKRVLDRWAVDNLYDPHLHSTDTQQLHAKYQEILKGLDDPQIVNGDNLYFSLKDYAIKKGGMLMMTPSLERSQTLNLLDMSRKDMQHTKSIEEQNRSYQEYTQQIDKLYEGKNTKIFNSNTPVDSYVGNLDLEDGGLPDNEPTEKDE